MRTIAYRTESQVATTPPQLGQPVTQRSFVKALFQAVANLVPDALNGILRVPQPPLATTRDAAAAALYTQLNACQALYPVTNLRLEYEILSVSPVAAPWSGVRLAVRPKRIRRTAQVLGLAWKLRSAAKPHCTAVLTGYLSERPPGAGSLLRRHPASVLQVICNT